MDSPSEYENEFLTCCIKQLVNAVKLFIKDGVNVRVDGEKAIEYACLYNDFELFRILLDTNEFTDYDKYLGWVVRAISYSLNTCNLNIFLILLDKGASFTTTSSHTILANKFVRESEELQERLIHETNLMSICDVVYCIDV